MKKYNKLTQFLRNVVSGYTTNRCVGIDIDSSYIKMVELEQDSLIISNYAISKITANNIEIKSILIEHVASMLNYTWHSFNKRYDHAAIKILNSDIIIKELAVPAEISTLEINNYLRNILIQDLGIENIEFDYKIIKIEDRQQLAQVVIAKKEKLEESQILMELAGIKLAAIEVETFALENLFRILLKSNGITTSIWIVDIEHDYIRAYFITDSQVVYSDTIAVNYLNLTKNELEFLEHNNILKQIVADVNKLSQIINSNLMVHADIHFNKYNLYLMGTNSIFPGLQEEIIKGGFIETCRFIDELFPPQIAITSRSEFMQLVTAIALATWGHNFA
ncbi:MAG: pilus assembly protein PilM [Burkholderiales bacterium]|nr:pilus assembly protein PilM [Burkholderiales bacterium]